MSHTNSKIVDINPQLIQLESHKNSNNQEQGFNIIYNNKKGWLIFSLPEVSTTRGIKKKNNTYTFTIKFDHSKPDSIQAFKAWERMSDTISKLVRQIIEQASNKQLTDDQLNQIFVDPTYLLYKVREPEKNKVKEFGYTMYLKLLNYDKIKS
jgi:hypothetical protein